MLTGKRKERIVFNIILTREGLMGDRLVGKQNRLLRMWKRRLSQKVYFFSMLKDT